MEEEIRPGVEARLEALREQALQAGAAPRAPGPVPGGPIPPGSGGYADRSFLKPPVWKLWIPAYFFIGGISGLSSVIAFAAWATQGDRFLVPAALGLGAAGAAASALLLSLDLGRPLRFHHMLRVFKWRSPMSVGAWLLAAYGVSSLLALGLVAWGAPFPLQGVLVVPAALLGSLVGTYGGVLLGATVIPVWMSHHRILPVHFGISGLGSAVGVLELLGWRTPSLYMLGLASAVAETLISGWQEAFQRSPADRSIRVGTGAVILAAARILAGPLSLIFRIGAWVPAAAGVFLAGTFLDRWGWAKAGRHSARQAEAAYWAHSSPATERRPS